MKKVLLLFFIILCSCKIFTQSLDYQLQYKASGDHYIQINITSSQPIPCPAMFIMPRSAPGTYGYIPYDRFVEEVKAIDNQGVTIQVQKGEGSRWMLGDSTQILHSISYRVNLKKMEAELLQASDSSKIRKGYLGLLGYSIFGYIDKHVQDKIQLTIQAPLNYPIFSTLQPNAHPPTGKLTLEIENFAILADGQIMLGPDLYIKEYEALVPLFVVGYAETATNFDEVGRLGVESIRLLKDYFGTIPFQHYTIHQEYLKPLDEQHEYGFSMEHLNSATVFADVSTAITAPLNEAQFKRRLFGLVHHIGHAWIPLRCYGKGYRPFAWEFAPIIEYIWLHEGFIWYITAEEILKLPQRGIPFFKDIVYNSPEAVQRLSLQELNQLASSHYSEDFIFGQNCFARGALMAHDINLMIKEKTKDKKSFQDAIRYLFERFQKDPQPITFENLPKLIQDGTGVDVSEAIKKWMQPIKK
ncbi:MAG: hypothetical protein IPJ74_13835 [Saprospiraceae bacterium]|nr:hypothetical protein [Saprospiraceae bacterium]